MRILTTIDLYGYFGTHYGADGASGAFVVAVIDGYPVATGIQYIRDSHHIFGTVERTEIAALAELLVDFNISLHTNLPW